MKFVWTEKAEARAQKLGLDERKAGTVAHIGKEILTDGQTAQAWLKDGYVQEAAVRPYAIVRRRYGKLYAVEYESASVGMTLYVDEDPGKAEAMYLKLDSMTTEQMRDYIAMR
ncbi:hypothetical protein [Caproiciproducens sp.]|uniref:hypothetical protein n=1 Tax=Caproiciproducens sp. TaxID=1954376 RepID=UPI0028970C27|nr:hypothetical protein [Caproiciproducens sp.]